MNVRHVDAILLLYAHPYSANAPTIMEHVNSFQNYSKYKIWSVNTQFGFPEALPELKFSVVVLHYSMFGSFPFRLNNRFIDYLKTSKTSYKIAFFQDEHQNCGARFELINSLSINCIYTLLEPQYFKDVYLKYTNVKHVFHTLTGYVDDGLLKKAQQLTQPLDERTIDVGYRARPLPFWMGKGAQEKTEIAEKFLFHANDFGLKLDIKTASKDRINGSAWCEFLANCKAVIGVEAGVSVFDLENKVRSAVEKLTTVNPNIRFGEVYERILCKWENNIYYRTISPRVFEAAAFRVCQVLYKGTYQGILIPMVHYIPLKKDYSNFLQVIKLLRNRAFVNKLTKQAYEDLIASDKYHYKHFINDFDEYLSTLGVKLSTNQGDISVVECQLQKGQSLRMLKVHMKHLYSKNWPGKALLVNNNWPGKSFVKSALCRYIPSVFS